MVKSWYRNKSSSLTYKRHTGDPISLTPNQLRGMNIPEPYWNSTMDAFRDDEDRDARITLSKYIKNIKRALSVGFGLVINGEYGTGKTSAAVICLEQTRRVMGTGYFITAHEYVQDIFNKTMYDDNTSVYGRVRDVDLLVIDDLGKEGSRLDGENDSMATMIVSLLKDRSLSGKSTIITSNLIGNKMKEAYGQSFVESIRDKMAIVTLVKVRRSDNKLRSFFEVK
jgi:DNA replication protein DnaC